MSTAVRHTRHMTNAAKTSLTPSQQKTLATVIANGGEMNGYAGQKDFHCHSARALVRKGVLISVPDCDACQDQRPEDCVNRTGEVHPVTGWEMGRCYCRVRVADMPPAEVPAPVDTSTDETYTGGVDGEIPGPAMTLTATARRTNFVYEVEPGTIIPSAAHRGDKDIHVERVSVTINDGDVPMVVISGTYIKQGTGEPGKRPAHRYWFRIDESVPVWLHYFFGLTHESRS